ncbi:MAG: DUF2383 domain-containing protein [Myxococcota bacterium]
MDVAKCCDRLNSFLRGEISAVETYRMVLDKLTSGQHRRVLEENFRSHERRISLLRDRIVQLGGKPSEGSGVWGAITKLFQGGANVFGEASAISALEEGEDTGLKQYRDSDGLTDLDTDSLRLIHNTLLPEQERTHAELARVKDLVSA